MGIKKIIYRVYLDDEEKGGLYFNNTRFKTLEPALERLIAEFDYKKMDLCAWMIGRNFKWLDRSLLDYRYENGQHRLIPKLDLFNPEAIQKLMEVYRELASHKIDCILIQDDFAIRYNEGFSSWGKTHFAREARVPAREYLMMQKNTPYNRKWNRVKINQLNKLLKLIVRSCKGVNSAVKVGINVYYETPLYEERGEAWYSHNLSDILAAGVDYIYLMSYHRQIKEEMKFDETGNRAFFKEMVEKAYAICKEKLIVKIQLRDWTSGEQIPVEEVRTYLDLIPPQVQGVCLTPVTLEDLDYLENILGKPRRHAKTREGKEGK